MSESLTIPTAPFDQPAMAYAFLRQEGLRHLERMAGRLWTDCNAHDPGITILEQPCYALTDLAYRIDYALPDLLAREGEDAYASLYSPAQILTSHPVTLTDLRKLREIMDVAGVRAVRTIRIAADGSQEEWSLDLDAHKTPKLALEAADISLERNQLTASVHPHTVTEAYHTLTRDERDLQPPPCSALPPRRQRGLLQATPQ